MHQCATPARTRGNRATGRGKAHDCPCSSAYDSASREANDCPRGCAHECTGRKADDGARRASTHGRSDRGRATRPGCTGQGCGAQSDPRRYTLGPGS